MPEILKSKTVWTAIAGIVGAAAGVATGDLSNVEAAQTVVQCLLAAFLRAGMMKGG
jgi:hypothetical protein